MLVVAGREQEDLRVVLLERVLELVLVADVDDLLELRAVEGVVRSHCDGIGFDCRERADPEDRQRRRVPRPAIALSTATAFAPCSSADASAIRVTHAQR